MNKEELEKQIKLMTEYAQMMLERSDYHGLWDAAIDLQRLQDKLENVDHLSKNQCRMCAKIFYTSVKLNIDTTYCSYLCSMGRKSND